MAVVFLEGGLSPIPMQMASAELHGGPRRRVCQFAPSNGRTHKSTKRNSLLNLAFLTSCDRAIEILPEKTIKK
jgi:hypothetical protein